MLYSGCSAACVLVVHDTAEGGYMEEKGKIVLCKKSEKRLRKPSEPFVSPTIRRCENEKEVEGQRFKRTKLEHNPKKAKLDLFQDTCTCVNSTSTEFVKVCDTPRRDQQSGKCDYLKPDANMELKNLNLILQEKQETLRKLNLVRMYRKKNNLENLQELISKWRSVSQESAKRLLNSITGQTKPTMGQLLQELQINYELICYSTENDTFC